MPAACSAQPARYDHGRDRYVLDAKCESPATSTIDVALYGEFDVCPVHLDWWIEHYCVMTVRPLVAGRAA